MTGPLFPENYSKIWIRGRFITMAGVAVRGKLTLAPTVTGGGLVNRSLKLIMSAASFSADTDNDGYVALQVPATNDPDITPINFTYSVSTPIGQKFSIVVPYDTTVLNSVGDPLHGQPVIELIDVVPVGSSGGVGQLLRGIGIQSMVDNGAGGLLITYTDLSTTTITMPDTVAGPPGPVGPTGPVGPAGPQGPTGDVSSAQLSSAVSAAKLADRPDLSTTGAAVGRVVAVGDVIGGVPSFTTVGESTPLAAYRFLRELQRGTRDLVWLHVGPSTSRGTKPWPRTVLSSLAAQYPTRTAEYIATVDTGGGAFAYQAAEVLQTGTGTRKITLYNSGRSGTTSIYPLGSVWDLLAGAIPTPDLITVSHGHNDAATRLFFRAQYSVLTETLRGAFPLAEMLLIADNPATGNANQDMRADEIAALAALRGYGFVNVHDAFANRPGGFTDLMIDTIHPNEAGHDLTAATVLPHLRWSARATPRFSSPSSLFDPSENLAPEGALLGWSGTGNPTGFVTTGTVTLSKDLTSFETKGYGLKVTSTAASGVLQYTLPADRLPLVKGQDIFIAVRLRVPEGQANGAGRIGFTDGTQLVQNGTLEGQGRFRWAGFTGRVSPTASLCRLLVYASDSAMASGGEVTIDRIICARGTLPRDYFTAA